MTRSSKPRARDVIRLDRFLPYRLSLLAHRLSLSNSDLHVRRHRLTLQEWKILSIIADHAPLTPVAIRRLGTQDKSTISWAIKRLLQRGFITARRSAGDGRTFEVRMSGAGWKYYDALAAKARRRARAVLAPLGAAELRALRRIVEKLSPR